MARAKSPAKSTAGRPPKRGIETVVRELANPATETAWFRNSPGVANASLPITVFGSQEILDFVWIDAGG
jgi:hypothetical protein